MDVIIVMRWKYFLWMKFALSCMNIEINFLKSGINVVWDGTDKCLLTRID
jgi:hypothetical protein